MENSQNDSTHSVLPEDPLEGMGDLSAIDPTEQGISDDSLTEMLNRQDLLDFEQVTADHPLDFVDPSDALEVEHQEPALEENDLVEPPPSLDQLIDAIDEEVGIGLDHSNKLEQELPPEPVREMAQFVTFSLAGTEYAVPIHNVTEIAYTPEVTSLPNVPHWIRGVANLRGDLVSLIDLRVFFGLEQAPHSDSSRMLVGRTTNEDLSAGLLVDRAHGIRYLPVDEIDKPTAGIESEIAPYLYGAFDEGEHLLILLDLDRVLNSPKLRQFEPQAV
jgi:purine-binding chemotaxis protein CheW